MRKEQDCPRGRNRLLSIVREKCPCCRTGDVFERSSNPFRMPQMKHHCDSCRYVFDREPGYFIGAMYVSYALAVLEGIITFLICHFFFPGIATIWIPVLILFVIVLFAYRNFRLSRIIYINIFPW